MDSQRKVRVLAAVAAVVIGLVLVLADRLLRIEPTEQTHEFALWGFFVAFPVAVALVVLSGTLLAHTRFASALAWAGFIVMAACILSRALLL